jgi:DNA-binding beta-propeller fold protein YncE
VPRPSSLAPSLAVAVLALASASSLVGCGDAVHDVASSSSIVLDPAGASVWVTSPDDDAVVELAREGGEELRRVHVEGGPSALAWVGPRLVVTHDRDTELSVLEPSVSDPTQVEVRRIATPCGGTAGVVADAALAWVACPNDDRVVGLEPETGRLARTLVVEGRPTGLARRDATLFVAAARRGAIVAVDLASEAQREMAPVLAPGVAASQLSSIAIAPSGGVHALYQRVEADADRERDPRAGGYGDVRDGAPRIEPRVNGPCGDRYARFDGGPLAMSGPSAVAVRGGLLWITHLSTDNVVLARCDEEGGAREGSLEVIATFRVGRAPRGLALTDDGRTAFVDVGFDWALARLDAPSDPTSSVLTPTFARRRERGAAFLSDEALRGRSAFFDAVDTHLTPSGVVTCGTCHPYGGEDGLSWFFHTTGVPRKLRRTPPAWGARAALAPFHWDGEFRDGALLSQTTTRELMQGDGLLVDFDAIAAFMRELPPPPPRPILDAAAYARGEAVFVRAGCGDCHLEPLRTDGILHTILAPTSDADATLAAADTPPLAGVRARAPYFHDGRAPTLRDTLTVPDDAHGRTSTLTDAEIDDLVAYLESL